MRVRWDRVAVLVIVFLTFVVIALMLRPAESATSPSVLPEVVYGTVPVTQEEAERVFWSASNEAQVLRRLWQRGLLIVEGEEVRIDCDRPQVRCDDAGA